MLEILATAFLLKIVMELWFNFNSPWDWDHIGIELGAKHIIHKKLANFMQKKDIYINRLESVIIVMIQNWNVPWQIELKE